MTWKYKGRDLQEPPEEAYGFLYKITTKDEDGKNVYYWGKKVFSFTKKKLISAKKKKETGTRKKYERVVSDSGWRCYNGSCLALNKYLSEGGEVVKKEILAFAYSKMDLTFGEVVLLIKERVLFRDDTWNGNILSKFFKNRIKEII